MERPCNSDTKVNVPCVLVLVMWVIQTIQKASLDLNNLKYTNMRGIILTNFTPNHLCSLKSNLKLRFKPFCCNSQKLTPGLLKF